MKPNSGVNIEDTQYAICKGTYGGKTWSVTERDAACKKYEQMTGKHVESRYQTSEVWIGGLAILVVAMLASIVVFYLRKSNKKYRTKKHKKSVSPRALVVLSFISIVIMAASFSLIYYNLESFDAPKAVRCPDTYIREKNQLSADGLVIAEGARLYCLTDSEKQRLTDKFETIDFVGKAGVVVSSVANIALLALLYRKTSHLKK